MLKIKTPSGQVTVESVPTLSQNALARRSYRDTARHLKRRMWPLRLFTDRRGATAMMFSVSALAVLGLVGLATEVGTWYLAWSRAQNAADAAALAGALAAAASNAANGPCTTGSTCATAIQSAANSAATDTARRNGYTNGAVNGEFTYTVSTPTPSLSLGSTSSWLINEVQIAVAVNQTYITSIFNNVLPTLATQSVAYVNTSPACVLSTTGQLTITSNIQQSASCTLASNDAADESAVVISGTPAVEANLLTAVADCSGCSSLSVGLGGLYQEFKGFQPPTLNPYPNTFASPSSYTPVACPSGTGGGYLVPAKGILHNTTYPQVTGPPYYAYSCPSGINLSSGTWLMPPGTYYFINTSLTINGTSASPVLVQCTTTILSGIPQSGSCPKGNGVAFLLLGSPAATSAGSLTIGNYAEFLGGPSTGATVGNFGPPASTNLAASSLSGVLFYGTGTGSVSIKPLTKAYLNGAIYFPNAIVTYGNATASSASGSISCTIVVGKTVSLAGTSNTYLGNPAGASCSPFGLTSVSMPLTQAADLAY